MKIAPKAHFEHNALLFKYSIPLLISLKLVGVILIINMLFPQPEGVLNSFKRSLQTANYQEVYFILDKQAQKSSNPDLFYKEMRDTDQQLQILSKKVDVDIPFAYPWQSTVNATSVITYSTPLGEIMHQKKIVLQREWKEWNIKWEWDTVLPHFSPADTLEVKPKSGIVALQKKDGRRYILLYRDK